MLNREYASLTSSWVTNRYLFAHQFLASYFLNFVFFFYNRRVGVGVSVGVTVGGSVGVSVGWGVRGSVGITLNLAQTKHLS